MEFEKVELYGGAITASIPAGLLDASTLRQIPDTQEVFLNPSTNTTDYHKLHKDDTIIFDLMERVDVGTGNDSNCVELHLAEIANLNGADQNEWTTIESTFVDLPKFQSDNAYLAVALEPARKWGRGEDLNPTLVVVLGIVRILKTSTDLLVTINVPISSKDELRDLFALIENNVQSGNLAQKRIDTAKGVVSKTLETLNVEDWSLFG
ncbi:unnamed protein product [Kuraishia capsulata CBS 1993]|uniref:Uncharacterized protein n=1 Tax=Kuraishia capsulata CBS 1993 TaxID=1382522 RepID=W6MNC7_9ASCO|nr:uncharacterized protein KUCA_T00002489001 [Kuraishia capsulata CBS 1993]CDK26517.1 unnamed protein product [Kuraishia capsulata CBS 1993]